MGVNWSGRSVLVTGAGGFIGSHLVETLVRRGANVRAFVRYNSRHDLGLLHLLEEEVLREVEVHPGDLRSVESVQEAMAGQDVVFHLGAMIAIPYSYVDPREYVETNVLGTLNVLNAARSAQVARVVHTSTSECYGTALAVPIREDHPLQAQSPYAASKIAADKMAESFHLSFGLPVATIRPFNTFGPRQSARAVIPSLITQALVRPVIRLGNLAPTRDFCFVHDTVVGFLKVAETDAAVGRVVNVGTGREVSIGDLARLVVSLVGRDVTIEEEQARLRPAASEVMRLCADNTMAREMLGWLPRVSLEEGLGQTIEWMRSHLSAYDPSLYQR